MRWYKAKQPCMGAEFMHEQKGKYRIESNFSSQALD